MDRATIISYLQAGEDQIANGEEQIANQSDHISSLERAGHDTTSAIELLREMKQTQMQHIADRDRLRAELVVLNAAEAAKVDVSILNATSDPRPRLKRRIRRTPYGRR
jgi:hypothetical protein